MFSPSSSSKNIKTQQTITASKQVPTVARYTHNLQKPAKLVKLLNARLSFPCLVPSGFPSQHTTKSNSTPSSSRPLYCLDPVPLQPPLSLCIWLVTHMSSLLGLLGLGPGHPSFQQSLLPAFCRVAYTVRLSLPHPAQTLPTNYILIPTIQRPASP